jgi:hypothetical protein
MTIWGSEGKQELISEGKFFCPKCNNVRRYKLNRDTRYTKLTGEFVECQVCKNGFEPEILQPGPQQMLKIVAITKYSLLRGTPLNEIKSRLIGAGTNDETVDAIIQKALSL